jgi:hypothetical protein
MTCHYFDEVSSLATDGQAPMAATTGALCLTNPKRAETKESDVTTLPLLSRVLRRLHPPPRRRRPAPARSVSAEPVWLDYHRCETDDGPRLVPMHSHDPFHPWGAPPSWQVLGKSISPQRPWLHRTLGGLVSLAAGVATALSESVSAFVATIVAGAGEGLALGAHLVGLFESGGGLSVIGRTLTVAAIAVPFARVGWRLARWGVEPIGDGR